LITTAFSREGLSISKDWIEAARKPGGTSADVKSKAENALEPEIE
jgi:hypothetical protein